MPVAVEVRGLLPPPLPPSLFASVPLSAMDVNKRRDLRAQASLTGDRPRIYMSNKTHNVVVVFPNGEIVQGKDRFDTGNMSIVQGRHRFSIRNMSIMQGKDRFNTGNMSIVQSKDRFNTGNMPIVQGKDRFNSGNMSIVQGKDRFNTGNMWIVQGKDRFNIGNMSIVQGKDYFNTGNITIEWHHLSLSHSLRRVKEAHEWFNYYVVQLSAEVWGCMVMQLF